MPRLHVLIDTNILLDILLIRQPFVVLASRLWQANDEARIEGFISSLSLANLFYLATKARREELHYSAKRAMEEAREDVQLCLDAFQVCSVGYKTVRGALALPGDDVEDNIQLQCAYDKNLDAIVTRDKKFAGASIPVLSPAALLQRIKLKPQHLPYIEVFSLASPIDKPSKMEYNLLV